MKILIGILIFLAVVIGIIVIFPAFIEPDVTLSRTIEIKKPVAEVYSVIKDYNYYLQWNPWTQMDKTASHELSGPMGEVGARWSWQGDTVGTGTLTIEELVENKSIKSRLEFIAPFESTAQDLWDFESIDENTTKVTWSYAGTAGSYFMRYMNLVTESMLGPQLTLGLENLKKLIESMPEAEPAEIGEETAENPV